MAVPYQYGCAFSMAVPYQYGSALSMAVPYQYGSASSMSRPGHLVVPYQWQCLISVTT